MDAECFIFAGADIFLPRPGASTPGLSTPGVPASGPGPGPGQDQGILEGFGTQPRRDYSWEGRHYIALALDEKGAEAATARGLLRSPLRQAIGLFDPAAMRPALKGLALLNWLEGARRCGACGVELVDAATADAATADAATADEDQGGRRCPACGRMHFPKISPAVIVLVRREGKALLARNARFPPGRFGLVAGFVDPGETLEEAAARELREEAGIEVRNLVYRKSQPWPFPDSLMLAFTADWAGGEAKPDGREIVELRWCGPDELPSIPPPGSVARWLIDEFVASRKAPLL
jgi:NAD+ diphosphatase